MDTNNFRYFWLRIGYGVKDSMSASWLLKMLYPAL